MFHVKPFMQFSLRLQPEDGEVLAALAADAGVKPGKMLHRMVGEALGRRRGELLLSARVGPTVGTRKDRAKNALTELAIQEIKAESGKAFDAAFGIAENFPLEETTEEPDFNLQEAGGAPAGESRDCPVTVGVYRCLLQAGHDDVHQWGSR